jgi:hypothetical protein
MDHEIKQKEREDYIKRVLANDEEIQEKKLEDYYKKHPEERRWSTCGPQQEIAQDGSRWWDADFC